MSTTALQAPPGPFQGQASGLDSSSSTTDGLDAYMTRLLSDLESATKAPNRSLHEQTLLTGLRILLGHHAVGDSQTWKDLIDYSRDVILYPKDDSSRSEAPWIRSTSALSKEFLSRYGPDTVAAAKDGYTALVKNHFGGDGSKIPHIDKKAHFLRNVKDQIPGKAYYPRSSPLATITYETGNVACSLSLLAWATPELAAILGMLTHHAICDDYHKFSADEVELRVRLVAMGVGAAYAAGETGPSAVLDGTLLQSHGHGTDKSVYSAMAWRAISGCSIPYSGALFRPTATEEAMVPPMILIAIHDMLDWRSDTAAGNHENSVTAVYGFGVHNAFHTYLETTLEMVAKYPAQTVPFVAAMSILHYAGTRYGGYQYAGDHKAPCEKCVGMLRDATLGAGFKWNPQKPPRTFAEGAQVREGVKLFIVEQLDTGMVQAGVEWFQYIVSTGEIWFFDLLSDGVQAVDQGADWA